MANCIVQFLELFNCVLAVHEMGKETCARLKELGPFQACSVQPFIGN